jgi:integrase
VLRGLKRGLRSAPKQAKALLISDLLFVLDHIGEDLRDARDKALLLIGFAGGFRRSELVGLDFSDVGRPTDQDGVGRTIGIPFGRGRHCPVLAMED